METQGTEILHPNIVRALITSETRKRILCFLSNYPDGGTYLQEIVKRTMISHSNVLGAIFGNDKNYSISSSLTSLGLVEVLKDGRFRYFKITSEGLRSIEKFDLKA